MNIKLFILSGRILFLALLVQSCTASIPPDISEADRTFLMLAGSAGIMEVKMGELAVKRAQRPDILDYAKMMVEQHTSFNMQYRQLMRRLNLRSTTSMNPENARMVQELAALNGDAFEKKYVENMVNDHKGAVAAFEQALSIARNPRYQAFLEKGLEIVRVHYSSALELQKGPGAATSMQH